MGYIPDQEIDADFFRNIVETLPNPVQVCRRNGTMLYCNKAFLELFHFSRDEDVFRIYDLWNDPMIEQCGLKHKVAQLRDGKAVEFHDIKVPLQDIVNRYGNRRLSPESIYLDIKSIPFPENNDRFSYILTVFSLTKKFEGKAEIIKSKEYIETHCHEKFNLDRVARASDLSPAQLMRLFKHATGYTPHAYYISLKVDMLKEKLLDSNLSVAQAFLECGVDYNGYYAKVFKAHTGMTPTEYRRQIR